jgi:hypothetical protein
VYRLGDLFDLKFVATSYCNFGIMVSSYLLCIAAFENHQFKYLSCCWSALAANLMTWNLIASVSWRLISCSRWCCYCDIMWYISFCSNHSIIMPSLVWQTRKVVPRTPNGLNKNIWHNVKRIREMWQVSTCNIKNQF